MIERLELIKKRYNELETELMNPEVISDYNTMKKLSKERSDLEITVKKYDELIKINEEIVGLKEMINDPDMSEIAKMELELNEQKKE